MFALVGDTMIIKSSESMHTLFIALGDHKKANMSNDIFTHLRKDMGWSDNLSSNYNNTLLDVSLIKR